MVTRDIRPRELTAPPVCQGFTLTAELGESAGHAMETRVFWHDSSYVRSNRVVVVVRG